jgi:hypothetical protein
LSWPDLFRPSRSGSHGAFLIEIAGTPGDDKQSDREPL